MPTNLARCIERQAFGGKWQQSPSTHDVSRQARLTYRNEVGEPRRRQKHSTMARPRGPSQHP